MKKVSKVLIAALGVCMCVVGIAACSKTSEQQEIDEVQQSVSQTETSQEISQEETETQAKEAQIKEQPEESQHTEVDDKINELLERALGQAYEDRYYLLELSLRMRADARAENAAIFIRAHFPDYFTDKTLIEYSIKYGHYEEMLYSEYRTEGYHDEKRQQRGKILCELAQKVYRGEVGLEDDYVKEQLSQIEEILKFFFGEYYGKKS